MFPRFYKFSAIIALNRFLFIHLLLFSCDSSNSQIFLEWFPFNHIDSLHSFHFFLHSLTEEFIDSFFCLIHSTAKAITFLKFHSLYSSTPEFQFDWFLLFLSPCKPSHFMHYFSDIIELSFFVTW